MTAGKKWLLLSTLGAALLYLAYWLSCAAWEGLTGDSKLGSWNRRKWISFGGGGIEPTWVFEIVRFPKCSDTGGEGVSADNPLDTVRPRAVYAGLRDS